MRALVVWFFCAAGFWWLRWFQNSVDDETRRTLNKSMHFFAWRSGDCGATHV